jgi:Cu/Ag efflux protein CusF
MTGIGTPRPWQLSYNQSCTGLTFRTGCFAHRNQPHFQGNTMTSNLKMSLSALALVLGSAIASAQSASADGVIRKLDLEAQRVLIKHGEWQGVNMMAMTMPFQVRDKALLKELNVNDTVHFSMEQDGREWVITQIMKTEPTMAGK